MMGIFDSGLGGLTILKEILKQLPTYDYIYLGDNARMPYGNKSQEVIYGYTKEAVDFLFNKGCRLIIIACHTASSKALRKIQQEYLPAVVPQYCGTKEGLPSKYPNKKMLGVIRPLVEEITKNDKIQRVGILGTRATVESNAYLTELHNLKPNLEVFQQDAPLLVPLVEEGWVKKPETKMILKKYLRPLKTKQVQALILACTHYPFLLSEIRLIMTKRVLVPNPGEIVAQSLANYLQRHSELGIQPTSNPTLQFFTTDDSNKFKQLGEKFLGRNIEKIERVKLSK